MKRVLIFSLAYYPKHVGGAEVAIKEITDRIDPSEIEFHMVTNRFDSDLPLTEKIGNVLVHRIGFSRKDTDVTKTHGPIFYLAKIFYIPLAALKACRLHQKYHYDGWWGMMSYMSFPIALLRLCGLSLPYVLTLQDGDPFEHVFKRLRIRLFSPLLLSGFRRATVIQTISTYLAGWARRFDYKGPIEIIPNGVNVAHFTREISPDALEARRVEVGKKEGDVFLVTTSRLVHKNAVDDVIRALPHLPESVHFLVLGAGPDEKMLRALTKKLGLDSRVHFLGHKNHNEMLPYLRISDIFVRPSRSEGLGVSFIETMAVGLPIIATQEGGIADFLFDAKRNPERPTTGWAVDRDAPEQIAEAVKDIVANPAKVKKVTGTASQMIFTTYDWNLIAHDMKEKAFTPLLQHS